MMQITPFQIGDEMERLLGIWKANGNGIGDMSLFTWRRLLWSRWRYLVGRLTEDG